MMADPESKDSSTALASRGQTPALALVLILATTVGAYNLSSRPGGGPSSPDGAPSLLKRPGPSPVRHHTRTLATHSRRSSRYSDSSTSKGHQLRWKSSPPRWAVTASPP